MNGQAATPILIVEDDERYRRLMVRMLEGAGFAVTAAGDFAAAMEVIESEKEISLLIADVGMPPGTPHGASIATMAKYRRRDLKVLYVTGGHDVARFALFTPGSAVLQKPFAAEALIAAVKSALE